MSLQGHDSTTHPARRSRSGGRPWALLGCLLALVVHRPAAAETTAFAGARASSGEAHALFAAAAPRGPVDYTPLSLAGAVPGLDTLEPGQGAVLVPALTQERTEPPWRLRDERGRKAASVLSGRAAPADPGRYVAEIGSGSAGQLVRVPVEVRAGQLARIRPSWGAVVIHTVDEEETPFRGLYLLFELLTRDSYGFGRGAEEELGEQVDTWLLQPGIYKVVGPLESFDARTSFTTVAVEPGRVRHYVLVMDRESGDFLGSGELPSGDFTVRGSIIGRPPRVQAGGFRIKANIGGDFSQSASDNVLGFEGNSLGFGLFTDFSANYLWKRHFLNIFLDLEGGIRKNAGESFVRKVRDEIGLSSIYIHQTWPRLGKYARFSVTSQLADTVLRFEAPAEVLVEGEEPRLVRSLKVSSSLDPLFLEEGAGINLRVVKRVSADLDARIGLSLRHRLSGGFLVSADDPDTEPLELVRLGASHKLGGELVLFGTARFAQAVSYRLDANTFVSDELRLQWDNTLSIRLVKSISVGVLLGLRRDETTGFRLGFTEAFFLRASKRVF
jgi:hypothetical protein